MEAAQAATEEMEAPAAMEEMETPTAIGARIRRVFPARGAPALRSNHVTERVIEQLRVDPRDQNRVVAALVSPRVGRGRRQRHDPFITTSFIVKQVLGHYGSRIAMEDDYFDHTFYVRLPEPRDVQRFHGRIWKWREQRVNFYLVLSLRVKADWLDAVQAPQRQPPHPLPRLDL
ncbi:unnamed protein product [Urochloa humidicola]